MTDGRVFLDANGDFLVGVGFKCVPVGPDVADAHTSIIDTHVCTFRLPTSRTSTRYRLLTLTRSQWRRCDDDLLLLLAGGILVGTNKNTANHLYEGRVVKNPHNRLHCIV